MRFKDEDGNLYYTDDDTLYVEGEKAVFTRKIGKLSTNLSTGVCNLVINREEGQKTNFGWMVSEAPFRVLEINYLVLIVDNKDMYLLNWGAVKQFRKAWSFKPSNGMEMQMVIPDTHWDRIKPDTGIVVNGNN
jgi:hypothetical protein